MWTIQCTDLECGQKTRAADIVDLIEHHTNDAGWFVCGRCGRHGLGGPPVLAMHTVTDLLHDLIDIGCIDRDESVARLQH
jgi:hypothetical protein